MLPSFRRSLNKSFLSAAAVAFGLSGAVSAATLTWVGGTGAWDNTSANWNNGGPTVWSNTANAADIASFGGTAGTVTLANTINTGGITFASSGYTIAGGASAAVNFGANTGVINASSLGAGNGILETISAPMTGTNGVTIASIGNLTASGGNNNSHLVLSGDNSGLTGGITVTAGIVSFTNSAAAGSASTTAGSGNVITLNGGGIASSEANLVLGNNIVLGASGGVLRTWSKTMTLNGAITGTGALLKSDGGLLILNGALNGSGTYQFGAGSATLTGGATGGDVRLNPTATLAITGGTYNFSTFVARNDGFSNSTATYNQSGGTVNVSGLFQFGGSSVGGPSGDTNIANITGGALNVGTLHFYKWATSQMNISGGASVTAGTFQVGWVDSSPTAVITVGNGTTGGTLAWGDTSIASNRNYTLNLNGGTIKGTKNNTAWMPAGMFAAVQVQTGGGTIDNGGFNITVANAISGVSNALLTYTGAGVSTFGGTSAYTVSTNVAAGTLALSAATGYAAPTTTIGPAGVLELNTTTTAVDTWRLNTILSGTGTINVNNGTSGWVQTGTNASNFSGTMNILAGTFGTSFLTSNWSNITADFNIAAGALLDARGQAITVGSLNGAGHAGTTWNTAATLTLGAGNKSGNFTGFISGNGGSGTNDTTAANAGVLSLIKAGTGTQVLSGANTYTGTTTVNGGVLQIGGAGVLGAGNYGAAITIGAGATFQYSSSADQRLTGAIGGAGALVKDTGTGTLTLAAANTYTGGTTVSRGLLDLTAGGGSNGAIRGALTINGGGTVRLSVTDALGYGGGANQVTTININGGTLLHNAGGNETWGTAITMTGGTMDRATGAAGAWSFGNNTTITTLASDTTSVINGAIILREGNTGNLTVFNVADGAADVDLQVNAAISEASPSRAITKTGAGTMQLTAANTYTSTITITGGTLLVGDGATKGSIDTVAGVNLGTVGNAGTLAFNRGDNITFSKNIAGAGGVSQVGGGTLTLSGTNGYTGVTTVTSGTLKLNNAAAFGGSGEIAVADASTFDANNSTIASAGLSGAGTVAMGTGDLTVNLSATRVLSGTLSGSGSLTKTGAGSQVIGSAAYTGITAVQAGTLTFGAGATGSFATSSVDIAAGAELGFNFAGTQTVTAPISGDGALTQGVAGGAPDSVLVLSGSNSYTGLTHVVSGTLSLGSAAAFAGGAITIESGATFDTGSTTLAINLATTALNGTGDLRVGGGNLTVLNDSPVTSVFDGAITGSGNFIKQGTGDLSLGGTSVFGGTLSIENGRVILTGAGTLTGTGVVSLTDPGSLVFAQTQDTTFTMGVAGNGGFTQSAASTGNNTLTGLVTGGVALTNEGGTGSLALTNAGDLGAVVNAGTTTISSATGAATLASVTNTAGTLTVSGDITGAIAVTGGTLTLGTGITDTAAKITGTATTLGAGALLLGRSASSYTLAGLSGDGTLHQNGAAASTITLAGPNTGLGASATIQVTSGVIAFGTADAVGSANLLFDGGTFAVGVPSGPAVTLTNAIGTTDHVVSYLTGLSDVTLSGVMTGGGAIRYTGPGALDTTGADTTGFTGQILVGSAPLDLLDSTWTIHNLDDDLGVINSVPGSNAILIVDQQENGTASGVIADDVNLVKTGPAELRLVADNTYTGTTTVVDGTLRVGDGATSGTLGSGAVILQGGLLTFDRSDTVTLAAAATGPGSLGNSGTGQLVLSGEINVGGLVVSAGGIRISHTAVLTDGVSGAPNQTPSLGSLTAYTGALSGASGTTLTLDSGANLGVGSGTYAGMLAGTGTFTKTGAGTAVLSGDSAFTGSVIVRQGTLQLGANGDSGALDGTHIAVGAGSTLAVSRSDSHVFTSIVTGPGGFAVTGTGTVIVTTANNYTGKTTIVSGSTLRLGDFGSSGIIGGGLVQADGTLEFARTDSLTFANTIVGAGGVHLLTDSTLRLTGANTYGGLTQISGGGTLELGIANLPTGAIRIDANSTLSVVGSGSGTFRGTIEGDASGTLNLAGFGTITLNDAPYAGQVSVSSGATLKLGASVTATATLGASEVAVKAGGRLIGSGYIAGNLINQGTVAPGFSPGLIVLGGDFTTTGVLNMEIAGPGAAGAANGYDQIRFGGTANLGGMLNVTFTNGFTPATGFAATLLKDTNVVAGQDSFSGDFVSVNIAGGTGRLIRGSDSIVFFSGSSLSQVPGLGLDSGVAAFADALTPNSTLIHPDFTKFINLYTASGTGALAAALQNASPVGLAALTALPVNEANKASEEIRRRAESQTMAAVTPFGDAADWLAYAGGSGFMLDADKGSSSPSFDSRVFGGYGALERRLGDGGAAVGLRLSYDNGTADLHDGGGTVTQNRASGTAYAVAQLGERGYVAGTVGMGYSSFDTKRNTLTGVEKASPTGWDISASIDAGYVFRLDREWSLTPHAGLSLVTANVGGFTERGDNLALGVDGYSQDSVTTRIGTGLVREWPAKNFTRDGVRLGLDVSYEHTLFGDTAPIPASFANVPVLGGFKSETPSLIQDSVLVGPQLQWTFDNSRTISVGYRFQYGFDGSSGHRADIAFEQRF